MRGALEFQIAACLDSDELGFTRYVDSSPTVRVQGEAGRGACVLECARPLHARLNLDPDPDPDPAPTLTPAAYLFKASREGSFELFWLARV